MDGLGAQQMTFSGLTLEKEPLTPPTLNHLVPNKSSHPRGTSIGLSSGAHLQHAGLRPMQPSFADALNDAYLVRQSPLRSKPRLLA